ncbi:glycosyltransferase family 2 protein [Oxalicibacterium solurbis]|uniref:Glycosyl transferase n=1 Tax=Oxalicibacterium solurbis TaxID=69280 RepID=A0A8J3AZM4_9BURK|nr:glycosyltransferase family 2 protein [Oxalicibacterium solurbis]GGI54441.1 glycosyl transferase [Oxalicibacterium solurbis]
MIISIITVCYNSAATIKDTLQSVAIQTYPSIEHLIVDGLSKDATMDVVRQFPHVTHAVSEQDGGIYDAMNKGIAMATGNVIGFVNADDFYASPDVLASVMQVFEDPTVEACYGDLCYVKQEETSSVVRYWRSFDFKPGLFLRGWCPPHPTFFVRKDVYERCGGFDLNYKIAADVELMMRFLEAQSVRSRYIPKILVNMRMGGTTNRSIKNVVNQNREIWRAFQKNGLKPSFGRFAIGKLLSRGKQFISRPQRV